MREILFRGKQVFTCAWVEGTGIFADGINTWISYNKPNKPIAYGLKHNRVYTETVGQFTGLTDKNDTKIFEGDIVKFRMFYDEPDWIGVVKYDTPICLYMLVGDMPDGNHFEVQVSSRNKKTFEVIGNIHDNPELLEVSDGN